MNELSSQNLKQLPNPTELKRICKSISAIEAIICPEWEYRYYSYQRNWSETEEFCEMKNGQGDHMLIVFTANGACINGFAHESEMNGWKEVPVNDKKSFTEKLFGSKKEIQMTLTQLIPEGVLDELPNEFSEFIFGEPVKSIGTTFCIWQTKTDKHWTVGKLNLPNNTYKDGSSELLHLLDGNPFTYKNWAENYYDEKFEHYELKIDLVEKIFKGTLITKELVQNINPEIDNFVQLKMDLNDVGYEHSL